MIYCVSDIHGQLSKFKMLIKKIGYNPEKDKLYIVGDAIDRGPKNLVFLDYIRENGIILIKGNHELFLQRYLEKDEKLMRYYGLFGGDNTIKELEGISDEKKEDYLAYLKSLPLYETVEVNGRQFILTHTGYMGLEEPVYKAVSNGAFESKADGEENEESNKENNSEVKNSEENNRQKVIDTVKSIEKWCATPEKEYDYLLSVDLYDSPFSVKFDRIICAGHEPTPRLEQQGIMITPRYINLDTGLSVIPKVKLGCICLDNFNIIEI